MCRRPSQRRRCSTKFWTWAIKFFESRKPARDRRSKALVTGSRRMDPSHRPRIASTCSPLIRRILLRDFGHRVRINLSPQQEFSMANDRQSRQQSSERAQTSGAGAQQGEWQPSQRSSMGAQGTYPQESQPTTRRNLARRHETGLEGAYPGFGPFSLMRRLTDDIDRIFENFGMGRSFFPSDLWQGGDLGRESSMAAWAPRIEMGEKDGKIRISADLPGVKKEDLDVHIDEDAVTIGG